MEIDIKEVLNDEVEKLWEDYLSNAEIKDEIKEILDRGFCSTPELKKDALMFVGINPSFNGKKYDYTEVKGGDKQEEGYSHAFYHYHPKQEKKLDYFETFDKVKDELLNDYKIYFDVTHIDLCFVRETEQKKVRKLYERKDKKDNPNIFRKFVNSQIDISLGLIEEAKPKAIIVSNAFARDILMGENMEGGAIAKWNNYNVEFDEEKGTYVIKEGVLANTPVFFSSMLSGQRALDKGSKLRLIWHIKYVLGKQGR